MASLDDVLLEIKKLVQPSLVTRQKSKRCKPCASAGSAVTSICVTSLPRNSRWRLSWNIIACDIARCYLNGSYRIDNIVQ